MDGIKLVIVLGVLFSLWGCNTKEDRQTIEIKFELNDDVSPVKVRLSVDETLHYASWVINDTTTLNVGGENEVDYIFRNAGISNVKLMASGIANEKYSGEINISIPELANRLRIDGMLVDAANQIFLNEDSLRIECSYFDGNAYTNYALILRPPYGLIGDTVFFSTPLIIDISGFADHAIMDSPWINFYIKTAWENEETVCFKSNFYVQNSYFYDRIELSSTKIKASNIIDEGVDELYILGDWKIE